MIVETSDSAFAGTDAEIRIKVFGTKGNVPERKISGSFKIGSEDTIIIRGYDIGHVTGMAIIRNNAGFGPQWRLEKITIKIAGQENSIFKYDDWVSADRWHTLTLSCPGGSPVNSQGWCGEAPFH